MIIVPTRELALQTSQVCKELGKHLKIQVMVTTGGTSLKDDIMRLYQPVHLLVGTPGRILDLSRKGVCVLKDCSVLVMDEVNTGCLFCHSAFKFLFIYLIFSPFRSCSNTFDVTYDSNLNMYLFIRLISFYLMSSNHQWNS